MDYRVFFWSLVLLKIIQTQLKQHKVYSDSLYEEIQNAIENSITIIRSETPLEFPDEVSPSKCKIHISLSKFWDH